MTHDVSRAIKRVGFIGTGNLGGPMAQHIIAGGFPTTLWARRPETLEAYAGDGVEFADSPAELGRQCDEVGICVWDDAAVEDVLLGEQGVFAGMTEGGTVAIHSTISPDTVFSLGEQAAARGITFIDAPVSGDRATNEAGNLLVMVGGPEEAFQRCRPVFDQFGGTVVLLGPLGSGTLAKLVNNVLLAAIVTLSQDALDLGQQYGLDREELRRALVDGSAAKGAAMGMRIDEPAPPSAGTPPPRAARSWARKDVELAISAARRLGIDTDRDLMALGLRAATLLEQLYHRPGDKG